MKLLLLIATLTIAIHAQSQTPQKIPQGLQRSASTINQDDWNLVDYQFKVEEIQTKIAATKANPKSDSKAKSLNWYEGAYKTLEAAKFERDTHIMKYEYKRIEGFPQKESYDQSEAGLNEYEIAIKKWVGDHPNTPKNHSK